MNAAGSPTIALTPHIREFVAAPHYASVATTEADGSPRQAVIWYLLEGDELVVNSRVGRHWPTNLLRDGRVYLAVFDETDPMRWVGLLGTAEPVRDQPPWKSVPSTTAAVAQHAAPKMACNVTMVP